MAIEAGSVVILKSGSPIMTVEELGEHKDARCTWFHGNEMYREWFSLVALRIAPPSPAVTPARPQPAPAQRAQG